MSQSWTPVGSISGPPGPPGADGDDGRPIELRVNATHLQWRQGSDGSWWDLLSLEALLGPVGEPGPVGPAGGPGPAGPPGPQGAGLSFQGRVATVNDLPSSSTVGYGYIVEATGDLHVWNGTAWVNTGPIQGPPGPAGLAGVDGADGEDGRQLELRVTATHIQWRLVGTAIWTDLIALAAITGPAGVAGPQGPAGANGQSIELRANATHVQWRVVGGSTWTDLIALSVITGPQGAAGPQGPQGLAGANGQNIELRTSATHVQWRVVGSSTWTDLVALSAITGAQGAAGPPGPAGPAGPAAVLQRQTLSLQTPLLAGGGAHDLNLPAGSLFLLLALQSSHPCWLRVYGDTAARTADTRSQPGGTLPAAGSGFYAELVTTSPDQLIQLAPVALVQAAAGNAPLRVVNTAAASAALSLQLTVLTLET